MITPPDLARTSPGLLPALEVRRISATETLAIRLPVLRAGMPLDAAIFPGDEAPATRHFGAFRDGELVGVASIYSASLAERPDVVEAWQLRGMATVPAARGCGFGRALLEACVAAAVAENGTLLWCNARSTAVAFYAKHGWQVIGSEFEIVTAGPHFRMALDLPSCAVNDSI